jgi:hypothetical protein
LVDGLGVCYVLTMFGPRALHRVFAMLLVCLLVVVRAGPACVGIAVPTAVAAMSTTGPEADCHERTGRRASEGHEGSSKRQTACGVACAAMPAEHVREPVQPVVAAVNAAHLQRMAAGLELPPRLPPPRT